jgi:large subunit ribosomal protein L23
MNNPHDIILKPLVTERSMMQLEEKKYTFKVDKNANKYQIKDAIEEIFDVKVEKVSVMNIQGKMKRMGKNEGRRASWKKAIIKLKPESKEIKLFENL